MKELATLPQHREERREVLQSFINSRLLPQHIKTVDQAELIVAIGREIGLPPVASLRTIHLISGTPTVSPAMMIALANQRSLIEDMSLEKTEEGAKFTVLRKGRKTPHTEFFGLEEARKLGLMEKDNYIKQRKTMFAWRAVSAGMRVVFPDVIFGLYTPEEMGAVVEVDSEDDLKVVSITAESDKIIKERRAVEEIKSRLAKHCDGDIDRIQATLTLLTEHKNKETGESDFVLYSRLDELPETKPGWAEAILKKIHAQKIGEKILSEQSANPVE